MPSPKREIPPERQAAYYGGMALTVVGVLLFLSVFVTGIANFGNFHNFEGQARSAGFRAIGGMVLIGIGAFLMNVGVRGLAGSGIVLDPEQAREDVEPWSRMAGGVVNDALSEVDVVKRLVDGPAVDAAAPPPQVKIRCRQCQALNDETAKFCNQCGAEL